LAALSLFGPSLDVSINPSSWRHIVVSDTTIGYEAGCWQMNGKTTIGYGSPLDHGRR
jgi:hypothetical protein